ncbi:MAG: integrase domain-containing protein [Desulfobacteraceae bacterium]|nr:integrase domain-containing protein [Desulfobacteraceae bacterium]
MKKIELQATHCIGKERHAGDKTHTEHLGSLARVGEWLESKYGLDNIKHLKSHMVQTFFREHAHLSPSTLEKYATAFRLIAKDIDKENIVPRSNKELGGRTAAERYAPKAGNAEKLDSVREKLVEMASMDQDKRYLVAAHDMRQAFGLRSAESLASCRVVERDGRQFLAPDMTKGGRGREIEIKTQQQRDAVAAVRALASEYGKPSGSMLPPSKSWEQCLNQQRNTMSKLGATKANNANMHVNRHVWAQDQLKSGESRKDTAEALGHGRQEVVYHYAK